jgi:hypothetical protein
VISVSPLHIDCNEHENGILVAWTTTDSQSGSSRQGSSKQSPVPFKSDVPIGSLVASWLAIAMLNTIAMHPTSRWDLLSPGSAALLGVNPTLCMPFSF